MKFGVVNESTILNRFVLPTLQRNITHLAVITRKTNIKLGILKGGETGKEPKLQTYHFNRPNICEMRKDLYKAPCLFCIENEYDLYKS